MRPTPILAAALAATLPSAARAQDPAKCYDSGAEFQGGVSVPIGTACRDSLSGGFPRPGFAKSACYQVDNVNKIDFFVRWDGGNDNQNLFESDCVKIMSQLASDCGRGGEWAPADFGQFFFIIDPNEGTC